MTHAQPTARQSPDEIAPYPLVRGASIRPPEHSLGCLLAPPPTTPWPGRREHGQAGRVRRPRLHEILNYETAMRDIPAASYVYNTLCAVCVAKRTVYKTKEGHAQGRLGTGLVSIWATRDNPVG